MSIIVGSGEYRYEVIENWGKLPDGWHYGEVAAVGVDSKDNVYVFARSEHPMMVFDRDGNLLRSWGEGLFRRAHGLHIGPDDTIYCTDDGDHTVRRMTPEGKMLLEIGVRASRRGLWAATVQPLHPYRAVARGRHVCVGRLRQRAGAQVFAGRKLEFSWGECGTDPGEFNIPHNICCDEDGWVYVASIRENYRAAGVRREGKIPRAVELPAPTLWAVHDARAKSARLCW